MRRFQTFLISFLSLVFVQSAFAETMKFVGPFEDSASQFQLILNVSVSRPGSSGNYTISGKIKAKDGDYSVLGPFMRTHEK